MFFLSLVLFIFKREIVYIYIHLVVVSFRPIDISAFSFDQPCFSLFAIFRFHCQIVNAIRKKRRRYEKTLLSFSCWPRLNIRRRIIILFPSRVSKRSRARAREVLYPKKKEYVLSLDVHTRQCDHPSSHCIQGERERARGEP